MSSSRNETVDPNLADLPPEAFEEIEGSPTPAQLEARIRIKREGAMQDAGVLQSPHHAADIEPIEPPTETDDGVEEEPPAEEDDGEEPTGEEVEEDDSEVDDPASEFYVGRYKSREDAEAALAEKDRTIAQLFRERHERETRAREQQPQAERQLDAEAWTEWAADAVESGAGVGGAMQALEQGGSQGYDIYIAQWMRSEDPDARAEAIAFNNEVQRQYAAELATQQPQQAAQTPVDEGAAARQIVAQRFPDFDQYAEAMDELVQSDNGPLDTDTKAWLAETARSGGLRGKAVVWDYLYRTAVATRAPVKAEAAKAERRQRRASADAAKLAATVSTSEGGQVRTPPSAAELQVTQKRNGIRERLGLPLLKEE